jgi:predicted nucleotidyltransferase component of viral defense system
MKDEALALVENIHNPGQKLNVLREFLQALTLRSLHESKAFLHLAFVGGTALRFLHNLPRFSEDLDFSLTAADGYEPEKWIRKLKQDLELAGFTVAVTWNARTTVHKSWIKVAGLLREAGLSEMANQNISIKLEIDTHPPEGACLEKTLVRRHRILALCHYDLSSLMAGKLHALITRPYPKGRDWYDFIWYRSQRPPQQPNLTLLQNALDQTQGRGRLEAGSWMDLLHEKIEQLKMQKLLDDVEAFLEHPSERDLFTRENFLRLLDA